MESVVFVDLVFVTMTATYSLAFQLMLLFNTSLITIGVAAIAWSLLLYTLIIGRGPWVLIYAKIHRTLTGVNALGITRVERLLLIPYVINYAVTMVLAVLTKYPLLNPALRMMVATPMFIMIGEFTALPRMIMSDHSEMA